MAKTKMWGGRFSQGTSGLVEEYTQSVSFDQVFYCQDIAGSKAHAKMLAAQGVLTDEEASVLCNGLDMVQKEIESGRFVWQKELEDVHMNIENRLTELVGDTGKKLHTGRSRNDQVALGFRLFVSDKIREWQSSLRELINVLVSKAEKHVSTLLPGYTHLQPAQPISLAQHLLAYANMFRRDTERLHDCDLRVRICPLGAAALAGTTYPLDPFFVAKELDMYGVFRNSMDAVSDRDFVLESMFAGSLIMAHLSRLCEDIILWSNPSFGFVRLPDEYSTGSSIMPQKKNPDVAELMRGKTGRVYGSLISLLTIVKGLPMTYNRDLQEDKEPFIDLDKTVFSSVTIMAGMMDSLEFQSSNMRTALGKGFLNATELADYLVGKGIPFREAHHFTGRAVALAEQKGIGIEELSLQELQSISSVIGEDVYAILDYSAAVSRRETHGGTGLMSIEAQIKQFKEWL